MSQRPRQAVRRSRGLLFVVSLLTLLAGSGLAITRVLTNPDDAGPATPQPREAGPRDLAQERYEAALRFREEERSRAEAALEAFAEDLNAEPDVARSYLVSFQDPVPVAELLAAVEGSAEVELEVVFIWLATEDSVEVLTGPRSAAALGWPRSADEVSADLRAYALHILHKHLEILAGPPKGSGKKQLEETRQIRRQVRREGVSTYGIACTCTPAALVTLVEGVDGLALRAVEEGSPYDQPIWPRDPVLDLIISSHGRYGR